MSKKNYVAIAAMLKEANASVGLGDQAPDIVLRDLCDDMANHFANDNPSFDRQRFLAACGVQGA